MTHQTKRPYRRAEETRWHVIDVAARLFYADGIRAVGIDRLAQEAEVTTATLYRLFGSKEGLVAAYLRRTDAEWFNWFEQAVAAGGLPQFFDELDARTRESCYRGCAFSMALAEYPSDSEIHSVAVEHKRRARARLRELVATAGGADPEVTAEQLMLVMNGMSTEATECVAGSPPGVGPALARKLLGATA